MTFTPSLGIVLSVSVIGAVVARFVHTEEVTGSNPVSRTNNPRFKERGFYYAHRYLCPQAVQAQPRTQPPENEVPRDNTRTRRSHRLRTHVLPQTRRRTPRPLHHHRHRAARQRPQRLARVHGRQSRPRRPARLPRHRIPRPQIRHHPRRSQRLRTIPRRSSRPRRSRPQLRRKRRPTRHGPRTQPR